MRKIDFGRIIFQPPTNPGYFSETGPYVAFVKGDVNSIDTVGVEKEGMRIGDKYENNFKIVDKLRKDYKNFLPSEWYFRFKGPFPSHGFIHCIDFSENETVIGTNQIQNSSENIAKNLQELNRSKEDETILSYKESKAIIEKLPDIGNSRISFLSRKLRGEELSLYAYRGTTTEKFKEAMDIYFSLINGNENFKKCTTQLITSIENKLNGKEIAKFLDIKL